MDDEIPAEDEDSEAFSDLGPEDDDNLDDEFQIKDVSLDDDSIKEEPYSETPTQEEDKEDMGFDAVDNSQEVALDQVNVSSVPVQIDLELTRVQISLQELQSMKPGKKLPLNVNPRIINLVVGGKAIGKGEIVNIGEAACVKVVELYK